MSHTTLPTLHPRHTFLSLSLSRFLVRVCVPMSLSSCSRALCISSLTFSFTLSFFSLVTPIRHSSDIHLRKTMGVRVYNTSLQLACSLLSLSSSLAHINQLTHICTHTHTHMRCRETSSLFGITNKTHITCKTHIAYKTHIHTQHISHKHIILAAKL